MSRDRKPMAIHMHGTIEIPYPGLTGKVEDYGRQSETTGDHVSVVPMCGLLVQSWPTGLGFNNNPAMVTCLNCFRTKAYQRL